MEHTLQDPSVPKFLVSNIITGFEEVMAGDAICLEFPEPEFVFMPSLANSSHRLTDMSTDLKKPYNSQTPNYLYIEPLQAFEEEKEEEECDYDKKICKLIINVEACAWVRSNKKQSEHVEGKATKRPPAAPAAIVAEKEGEEESEFAESFTLDVDEYDWATNTKTLHLQAICLKRQATYELNLPIAEQGKVLRVVVSSAMGYHLSVHSSQRCLLESLRAPQSIIWEVAMGLHYRSETTSYPAQRPHSTSILGKYSLMVVGTDDGQQAQASKGTKATKLKTAIKVIKAVGGAKIGVKEPESVEASVLPTNMPVPFASDAATWVSFNASFMDKHFGLKDSVVMEIVNNDTLLTAHAGLLSSGPLRLLPNMKGYTVHVIGRSGAKGFPSAQLTMALIASKALAAFTVEPMGVQSEYSDTYRPNFHYNLLRNVISAAKADQVFVEITTNDPQAGLLCEVFNVADLIESEDAVVSPVLSLAGLAIYLPVLEVSKEQKYLVEIRLDPLSPGTLYRNCTHESMKDFALKPDLNPKKKELAELMEDKDPDKVELRWTMRCVSNIGVFVQADKTQDEEFKAIRSAWAKVSANRGSKSKESREKFLKEHKALSDLAQQPIEVEARAEPQFPNLLAARKIRDDDEEKGKDLLRAMDKKRDWELDVCLKQANDRDDSQAASNEMYRKQQESFVAARTSYRDLWLHQDGQIQHLRQVANAPVLPFAQSLDTGKKAKVKTEGIPVSEHMAGVLDAIDKIAMLPKWRTADVMKEVSEHLSQLGISCLQEGFVHALPELPDPDHLKPKLLKKKDEISMEPAEFMLAALQQAKAVPAEYTKRVLQLWITRAQAWVYDESYKELQSLLHLLHGEHAQEYEPDMDRVEKFLNRCQTYGKPESESDPLLEEARVLVGDYKENSASRFGQKKIVKMKEKIQTAKEKLSAEVLSGKKKH